MTEVRPIDANEVFRIRDEKCPDCASLEPCFDCVINRTQTLDYMPVVHGRWIEDQTDLICSVCKWKYSDELPFMSNHGLDSMAEAFAHCPHCGARMDGGADNG